MNGRVDKFLLGILWLCACTLATTFWFNVRFGFNLFNGAHWRYFSQIQLSSVAIAPAFYISFILFAIIGIGGLYLIIRPRFRKIRINSPARPASPNMTNINRSNAPHDATANVSTPPVSHANIQRPPSIVVPLYSQNNNYHGATTQKSAPPVSRTGDDEFVKRITDAISAAGYTIKKPPKIGKGKPSVLAIGMDEVLLIGLAINTFGDIKAGVDNSAKWTDDHGEFESPVWMVNTMADRLRALFTETLDESLKITVMPFVVTNAGNISNIEQMLPVWETSGVSVFQGTDSFDNYIKSHHNRIARDNEKEDFDAYSEYMDTVADYFNSEV